MKKTFRAKRVANAKTQEEISSVSLWYRKGQCGWRLKKARVIQDEV
jgi:hypothetical protein